MSKIRLNISGMSCANCANAITRAALKLEGVKSASVSIADNSGVFELSDTSAKNLLINKIKSLGFGVAFEKNEFVRLQIAELKSFKIKLCVAVLSAIFIMLIHFGILEFHGLNALFSLILSTISVCFCGTSFYLHAYLSLKERNFDMNTLISLGVFGAYFYSLCVYFGAFETQDLYFDAPIMIIAFVLFGKFLESSAKVRSSEHLQSLIDLCPKIATKILPNGENKQIKASELQKDDIISVKSGESIASDGIIIFGGAMINEAMINGESLPKFKSVGGRVFAGSINLDGALNIKIDKKPDESVLSTIIDTIENANSQKLNIARLGDKISNIFVPFVVGLALFTLFAWSFVDIQKGVICALSVLVISCPCALGLATPVATFCALSASAKSGILIKNPAIIEIIALIKTIAFDKTGTLTKGQIEVISTDLSPEFQHLAGQICAFSDHPISKAICAFTGAKNASLNPKIKSIAGMGLEYENSVLLGNSKLLEIHGIKAPQIKGMVAHMAKDGKYLGHFLLSDRLKIGANDVIQSFKAHGIKTAMLSGDNKQNASKIGAQCGVDEIYSELLPNEKSEILKTFKPKVMFVGDGINDAIAMKTADIAVAMSQASDIAKTSGDAVLINSDIKAISRLFEISTRTLKIIKQNLFWAFCYNAVCLPLACGLFGGAGVFLTPVIASFAMSMSSLIVVLNSLRVLKDPK